MPGTKLPHQTHKEKEGLGEYTQCELSRLVLGLGCWACASCKRTILLEGRRAVLVKKSTLEMDFFKIFLKRRDIKNKKFRLTLHLFQICTKCVRCKSCGSTTPGKGWDAQWSHDFSLCHDCAKLFAKGNSEKLALSAFRGWS